MITEIATHTDFSDIRYAQCWEDADILLQALDMRPGDTCLSIASAGDNTLALLTRQPQRVIAVDLSPAQLACLELRVAAYRVLSHGELLVLMGSHPDSSEAASQRQALYQRCRGEMSPIARHFWDDRPAAIADGIGAAGKFERYFAHFRRYVLPLIHSSDRVMRLLQGGTLEQRQQFYQQEWNSWRWQLLFRLFFSRWVMGRLGRDPRFFHYVEGHVADRLLDRTCMALTHLNPAENPYLQWILTGQHHTTLPYALRPEHFDTIRANLDRLEWHCCSVEDFLEKTRDRSIDRYNLSDMFEYVSPENYQALLRRLVKAGRPGGRLVYWNMMVPRSRPATMATELKALTELAQHLYGQDKAFFYSALVIEEIIA